MLYVLCAQMLCFCFICPNFCVFGQTSFMWKQFASRPNKKHRLPASQVLVVFVWVECVSGCHIRGNRSSLPSVVLTIGLLTQNTIIININRKRNWNTKKNIMRSTRTSERVTKRSKILNIINCNMHHQKIYNHKLRKQTQHNTTQFHVPRNSLKRTWNKGLTLTQKAPPRPGRLTMNWPIRS